MLDREHKKLEKNHLSPETLELMDHIAAHLLSRVSHYNTTHDENDKTTLGNVNFWLIRDRETKTITLGFSTKPTQWDVDRIKLDIMLFEHKMFEEKGVAFDTF